jgi:hypothetical protein
MAGNQRVSIAWTARRTRIGPVVRAYRPTYQGAPRKWWSELARIESRSLAEDAQESDDGRRNLWK